MRRYGYRRRRRRHGGLGIWGPIPTYSTRTRRGSRVTVPGCCLPIPLGLVFSGAMLARALRR